jgi:protein-tyrosine-phosphatase
MNILFVCKYNRFRSKVAEALFNQLNKNPKNKAKSGGLFPGTPMSKRIFDAGRKFDLKLIKKRRCLDYKRLTWADRIIIVANDVPLSIFKTEGRKNKTKIIKWNIQDYYGDEDKKREDLIRRIKSRVELLLKEIS